MRSWGFTPFIGGGGEDRQREWPFTAPHFSILQQLR
jgi:hypothetical protein